MAKTVKQLVTEAKGQIRNLNVDEVARQLEGAPMTLVDIREPDEVARDGHIPGAVLAPRGMLEFYADPESPYHRAELSPAAPTVVYCASGGRSALATAALQNLGYSDVAHLDGGLKAWIEQGRPVTRQVS
ncbi:rhodanese-like domain-containing protein [Tenggerimyces flavus]|uniref:Rhodanese-like domain-containing protein n=1 Tax=Tenggerimyces flavus TaxID=1708749 RepID=A0ABV7YIF9_9ACTN|nr:rhodanese-like domain-containing protein [Tenggerimyces flavus]MBM7789899.1 rhodanese-related sulfurtransferase [Tenggerimyces flavus]